MKTKQIIVLMLIFVLALGALLFQVPRFQVSQVRADATTATSSASVINAVPTASDVSIDNDAASVTLTENTTVIVTTTAIVTDTNGCEDIDSVTVTFYKTTTGFGAADDENNHYATTTMTQDAGSCSAGGADTTATYTATTSVWYYADATDAGSNGSSTDWTARVLPSDESAGTADTDTIEMATLTALDVTTTIAYGELALNADTGTGDTTTTITNTGNERIDVQVDGYGTTDSDGRSMTCTFGTTTIDKEKYATSTGVAYASRISLTDSAVTVEDMNIAQRTNGATTGDLYWGFGLPLTGVGGDCTGKVVFTAYSDPVPE